MKVAITEKKRAAKIFLLHTILYMGCGPFTGQFARTIQNRHANKEVVLPTIMSPFRSYSHKYLHNLQECAVQSPVNIHSKLMHF